MTRLSVLDLFAGAGGFSLGAHALTDYMWGIELDADAVATQKAYGMLSDRADITTLDPHNYADQPRYREMLGDTLHVHASPPCQSFSVAGKGDGRKHLEALGRAAYYIIIRGEHFEDLSEVPEGSLLVLEPARWIHALRPDSISMEQVRSVLPIWESYAAGLRVLGYQTWTALLHSEQHGVPQTRTRAWLGASLHREVEAPNPTHSRYHVRNPAKLDAGLLPWVSMAEALGWGMTKRGSHTVTAGGTSTGGAELFGNGARQQMAKHEERGDWSSGLVGFPRRTDGRGEVTTIDGIDYRARDFRKGVQPAFGLTSKSQYWTHVGDRAGTTARRVTVEEAGILQGFPDDFPWQGSKTSQFRQVGNAVNPAVAEAVLRSVL
jgi:DNA (cytosine-5)-methyltransferase 1